MFNLLLKCVHIFSELATLFLFRTKPVELLTLILLLKLTLNFAINLLLKCLHTCSKLIIFIALQYKFASVNYVNFVLRNNMLSKCMHISSKLTIFISLHYNVMNVFYVNFVLKGKNHNLK